MVQENLHKMYYPYIDSKDQEDGVLAQGERSKAAHGEIGVRGVSQRVGFQAPEGGLCLTNLRVSLSKTNEFAVSFWPSRNIGQVVLGRT